MRSRGPGLAQRAASTPPGTTPCPRRRPRPRAGLVVGVILVRQVEQALQVHPHAALVAVDGLPVVGHVTG
jgi:hypothetical protein